MPIVIHPLNRGVRPLKVVLHTHGNEVRTAEVSTTHYWEHAKILKGKQPADAIQIGQRTNGIDFISHAVASARAIEEITQTKIPNNAQLIRNILIGLDMIHGHINHFYQCMLPDYIPYPGPGQLSAKDGDFRIPREAVDIMLSHVWRSFEIRSVVHRLIAIIGGKAPHVCSIVPGGVTKSLSGADIVKIKSMIKLIGDFINREYSHDLWQVKKAYPDYFHIGSTEGRLLTFGEFPLNESGDRFINPMAKTDRGKSLIDKGLVTVECTGSWFDPQVNDKDNSIKARYKPFTGKPGGYSWVKGLVYEKQTYETGALARTYLAKNKIITGLGKGAISVMGRCRARLEESARVIEQIGKWVDEFDLGEKTIVEAEPPENGEAVSFAEASGGSVIHYLSVSKSKIQHYNIFDSFSWNLCPITKEGQRNPIEQALTGSILPAGKYPIQVYRIARSF